MMALSGRSLGKYVCKLKINGNMQRSDDPSIHDFLNRMIVHFNMLRMLLKIVIRMTLVLFPWRGVGLSWEKPNSANRQCGQTIFEQATNIAWYSDSAKDLDTRACFLLFQEIKESPRNMHHPVTEWRVLGHPSQSTSLNAMRRKGVSTGKNNPQLGELLRYQMIRRAAKCRWRGDCINWLICWLAKEIWSCVIVK